MPVVKDQVGNNIAEGDEVAFEGKFGPVTIQKITTVMEPGPMNGGTIVEGLQLVRWFVPPNLPPVIPAFKITHPLKVN